MAIPRIHNREPGHNVFVVAEIGKNFIQTEEDRPVEEYIANAKALIDAAQKAGADAVKFQTHEVEDEQINSHIVSPHFPASDRYRWVKRNTEATPVAFWEAVAAHCKRGGILFFSTPMSRKAARKLEPLDLPFWKVGSADVQDAILLNELMRTGKPIIISTGMVSLAELDDVVKYLQSHNVALSILYCVSHYPCPPEAYNLATIELLSARYPDAIIGFSDHSLGAEAALAAVRLGARIIEKHFSLSRDLWGSDHRISMTPDEMAAMVRSIRNREFEDVNVAPYYGDRNRELEGAANMYRPFFGKKLVAGRNIPAGAPLTEDMIYAMRPAQAIEGLPSNVLPRILGKKIAKSLKKYDPVSMDILF